MAICPDGHETKTEDFCDQCGMPVVSEPTNEAVAEQEPATQQCPHCQEMAELSALFCEACGYDFTTGALPGTQVIEETAENLDDAHLEEAAGEIEEIATDDPSQEEALDSDVDDPPPAEDLTPDDDEDDSASEDDGASEEKEDTVEVNESSAAPRAERRDTDLDQHPPPTSPPRGSTQDYPWVAEIWVDPQWHAFQESADPLPPLGRPRIVALGDRGLIGRYSDARQIRPEIDCEPDAGCSRRQAYLTWADGYWYVNDLDSANGTFVGSASGELPSDPIDTRTRLSPDMRIYVGAWTRIVVRPALTADPAI